MLALHRAGLLQFLGPGLTVAADGMPGHFVATSPQSDVTIRAKAFIEARLPGPEVARSANPLLRPLHSSGIGTEQHLLTSEGAQSTGRLLVSSGHEPVGRGGKVRRRLFGVGPGTSGWGAGAFAPTGNQRRWVLAELEQLAAARGYSRIYLSTGPRQPEARHLYLNAGYTPHFDLSADPETIGRLAFAKDLRPRSG